MLRTLALLFIVSVNICFAQQAAFTADVVEGCFPLTVHFTDNSTGTITSRNWNFGNSNTSNLQNPDVIYSTPGTYTVSLTVFNGASQNTLTKTAYINVYDYPSVNFTFDKNSGCAPLDVKFTDLTSNASGAITDRRWVFGDGGTSTDQNPTYTYRVPGNQTVSLKIKNEHGCEITKTVNAAVVVRGPLVSFTPDNAVVCQLPATFKLTNQTTGDAPVSYSWNFGDGANETTVNPTHMYNQAGQYNVTLTARDGNGCQATQTQTLGAGSAGGLNFTPSATKICAGQSLTFTVQPNATILTQTWNFGNGQTSNDPNPSVTFQTAGTYTITLSALLQGNSCNSVVTKTIQVIDQPVPFYTFTVDCDYNVAFTSTSTNAVRLEWYVGTTLVSTATSFIYPAHSAGDLQITLVAYNSANCSEQILKTATILPKPIANFIPDLDQDCILPSLSGCAPFSLQLTDQSQSQLPFTSSWSFGDGATSTNKNPLHVYTTKGTFILSLTIKSTDGCTNTMTRTVTVSDAAPIAKFTLNKTKACEGEEVTFTDQSTNGTFWCWNFGDDTKSTDKNPVHKFKKPGIYSISVIVKNGGCTSTFKIDNAIEIVNPHIDFALQKNCSDPFTIKLRNLSDNYNSIQWDFGDGTTSATDVTSHTYTNQGQYTVTLRGTNDATHCIVDAFTPITIQKVKADFEIDNTKPCKGAPVLFTDKSVAVKDWEWTFGNGKNSLVQGPVSTTYDASGTFTPTLKVYDSDGCSDQKSLSVEVLGIDAKFDISAISNCTDFTVNFQNRTVTSPPVTAWQWSFGDGGTSTDENPQYVYHVPDSYPVTLTVTNANGTCSFIKYDAVKFTIPDPVFNLSKPLFCIGETIQLYNNSANANEFLWDLGNGATSTDFNTQVSFPATGKYPIRLTVKDNYGCEKSLTKNDFITITQPTADFSASQTSGDCPPVTTLFKNQSSADVVQWRWDFGDGKQSQIADPANTYIKPGKYDVKLAVTDGIGCKAETVRQSFVNVGGPSGRFVADGIPQACTNSNLSFTATTINATTLRWDYGDGVVEDKTQFNTQHVYGKSGNFTVSLVLLDQKGCKGVADGAFTITIKDTSKIALTYSPECIFEGHDVKFEATSDDKTLNWGWLLDGQRLGSSDPLIQSKIDSAGIHQAILSGTNDVGCISRIIQPVPVQGNIKFIPNVFTPNGDQYNNSFEIKGLELSDWSLNVYNRWGTTVYQNHHYKNNWDGGGLASDVYYYILNNATCGDNVYKGNVTIVR